MSPRVGRWAVAAFAGALLLGTSALALDGIVVDESGKPIEDARACYVAGNVDLFCSATNAKGRFNLPSSKQDEMRIVAEGFLPRTLPATTILAPVVLQRSPTLLVRLVDRSSGEPIADGEVSVVYTTGQSRGPFPVNVSGVRIRRVLGVGEARVVVTAPGFRQERPHPIRLEPGKASEVEIALTPVPDED